MKVYIASIVIVFICLLSCASNIPPLVSGEADQVLPLYKNLRDQKEFLQTYDSAMMLWKVNFKEYTVEGRYGITHITECGDPNGAPLILLHWFCNNSTVWYKMVECKAINEHYRIIAVDVMGDMGKSIPLHQPKDEEQVADWLNGVLDSLHLDSVYCVGHSYGGFVAATFAIRHPERVKKLLLLAPISTIAKPRLSNFFGPLFSTIFFPSHKRTEKILRTWCTRGDLGAPILTDMLYYVFKYGKIQTKLYPRTYSIDELKKISMPTMLLVGDNEVIYHPKDAFIRAGKGIPILTTQLLPDCGHAIPTDQPELTANSIAQFFK